MCKKIRYLLILVLIVPWSMAIGFSQIKSRHWRTIRQDQVAYISYDPDIKVDAKGNHIVWVKAEYQTDDWKLYFASLVGSRVPVASTVTKAQYDQVYNYVIVRQVIGYSQDGKLLFKSDDDTSAGWTVVNASDPVGIVGEYLCDHGL